VPRFIYVAKDSQGNTHKDVLDATNQQGVVDALQRKGFFPVSVRELDVSVSSASIKKKRRFSHKKVRLNDLLVFCRQLATMLEAGITLLRSLDVILSQVESEGFHGVVSALRKDVEQGGSLSLAMSKHPKVFTQFWVSLVEVGEASGTMPVVLNKLAAYLEQQTAFRSKVTSGLIYPAILFLVSMGAVGFFALFVGPRFESVFKSMKVDLPLITIILLAVFKFVKVNLLWILGFFAFLIFMFRKYAQTYNGKLAIEKFLFSLPTVGEIYKLIIVERFASQLSLLIEAGVPILYALDISERLVDNGTCSLIINGIKEGVKQGELIVAPMERSGFFPPMCVQMIMVGEETGELSKMLKHIAAFYQNTVETFMDRFATVVEPIMLVFMGGLIGTIVVAMFLPMFNITKLGGG
jgi:type IV pilus assembly protein PilC